MRVRAALLCPVLLGAGIAAAQAPTVQDRIIAAAEAYLGKPYVFGGRDGRKGCRRDGKRVRCPQGIDCQSLIFFAYEKVLGTPWWRFSVMPSQNVKRQDLGKPVPGVSGVLRGKLDPALLHKGDVLFFLCEDCNLQADPALHEEDGKKYGTWHTGLVHGRKDGVVQVIHADPGDKVLIEPLDSVSFDALFAVRLER